MSREAQEQFLALSEAYLQAAEYVICREIDSDTLPDAIASACMFNSRLAVELFLKGMIVSRSPSEKCNTHVLEKLREIYNRLFPDYDFRWDIPFTVQVAGGDACQRAEAAKLALAVRPLDQVFRYPTDNKGMEWDMVKNVSVHWMKKLLENIRLDMKRIRSASESP